jgi:hypothetical protein
VVVDVLVIVVGMRVLIVVSEMSGNFGWVGVEMVTGDMFGDGGWDGYGDGGWGYARRKWFGWEQRWQLGMNVEMKTGDEYDNNVRQHSSRLNLQPTSLPSVFRKKFAPGSLVPDFLIIPQGVVQCSIKEFQPIFLVLF